MARRHFGSLAEGGRIAAAVRLALGRPRVALVVAPHPDDEVIGAAGLIRALRRRGTRVHVVIVTDGAASHPNSRLWPRTRLVAERRRESRRALRRLGLPADRLCFLALADGTLLAERATWVRRLHRAIARRRPDLLIGPAADDAHPDHRAVAQALSRQGQSMGQLAYRVWPARAEKGGRKRALAMPGGHAAKRSLIHIYRTQLGVIRDDPAGFAIARHELDRFAHGIEYFTWINSHGSI